MTELSRTPCVVGNWKMYGNQTKITELMQGLLEKIPSIKDIHKINMAVCPPFPYLQLVHQMINQNISPLHLGAQNVYYELEGAFTGEVSPTMLVDFNCRYVIIGHSERRQRMHETDELIARKFKAAYDTGLIPILCVGETEKERRAGDTFNIVLQQLQAVIDKMGYKPFSRALIAYEPIWAIGTGLTATPKEAAEVHALLRSKFKTPGEDLTQEVRILYGGSVKANNVAALFAEQDIDGALVGGASLNGEEFLSICQSAVVSLGSSQ